MFIKRNAKLVLYINEFGHRISNIEIENIKKYYNNLGD